MPGDDRHNPRSASATLTAALLLATTLTAQTLPPATTPGSAPERVPALDPPDPVAAELPEGLLQKLRSDLAERIGAAAAGAEVLRAESVVWPDGGLGCGVPGESYTQGLVPGYRVELAWQGRTYAYHAAQRGYFKLCSRAMPLGSRAD